MNARIQALLRKQLSERAVIGILALFAVVLGASAWKFVLAPPAPVGITPMTKQQFQDMLRKNGESISKITDEQLRLYAAAHKNDPPPAAPTKTEGYAQIVRKNQQHASHKP